VKKFRSHHNLFDQKKETVHFYVSSLIVLNDTKANVDYSEMGCFKDNVKTTPSQLLEQRF